MASMSDTHPLVVVTRTILRPSGLKRCSTCKGIKEFSAFAKSKSRSDGLNPHCRECMAAYRRRHKKEDPLFDKRRGALRRAIRGTEINRRARERYKERLEHERERSKKFRREKPEKAREATRRYREANREKANALSRLAKRAARVADRSKDIAYRAANRARIKAQGTAYRKANAERIKAQNAAYIRANRGSVNARTARRTAARLQATPSWADLQAVRAIYEEAASLTQSTGIVHEVDHIYPMQSRWVCGLHCEANLQIVPRTANRKKGNRHWPGMDWSTHPTIVPAI